MSSRRRFAVGLAAILTAGAAWRVLYLVQQAARDPFFNHPVFDGAYYVAWARALVEGRSFVDGAFYLAPMEAWLTAAVLALGGSLGALYALQQLLAVVVAGLLALVARPRAGNAAALTTAALVVAYHPLLYFASRPLAELPAIALLCAALALADRRGLPLAGGSGLALGAAVLARPNLLLVVVAWGAGEALARRPRRAAALLAGAALVVAPVALRNYVASGHLVPVSSNAGMTAYHGNGPGAEGLFTRPAGFSGEVATQRAEATTRARQLSGRALDPVEADGWWGRQALRTRLEDPAGSLVLLARRAMLTLDDHEFGLDYHPLVDPVPARLTLRWDDGRVELPLVPFALLVGLSLAGLLLRGAAGSGGWRAWSAILACAATTLLFYVSSRYRLPMAALLTLPAGAGAAALCDRRLPAGRRATAGVLGLAALTLSLAMPTGPAADLLRGQALSQLAVARLDAGDAAGAQRDVERAAELAPNSAVALYHRALISEKTGHAEAALADYRRALDLDPGLAEAAANLARLLLERGIHAEAVARLRAALARRPSSVECWYNLVVQLVASGDGAAARRAVDDAARNGVTLDPELVAIVRGAQESSR